MPLIALEVGEALEQQLQLAHMRLASHVDHLWRLQAQLDEHVAIPGGPAAVVVQVKPVLYADQHNVFVDHNLPKAPREIGHSIKDNVLPA
eukprot:CAMPEP_0206262656 /NCGR_PEP_ID=MMETSP0047_2-20121206/28367_1 /ASSEMBLY_ACC=CAM_ASM_000192 /TAXON_ID=195065 /ORGANISM="Chroomonas mesostigmatica_cf, Strain CCMP1168" /LENGTH=89 /DNA_ID=CAMNT_0053690077 /DNA_START=756 /DNA_END=1025 /DNA_ORIENTATION=+